MTDQSNIGDEKRERKQQQKGCGDEHVVLGGVYKCKEHLCCAVAVRILKTAHRHIGMCAHQGKDKKGNTGVKNRVVGIGVILQLFPEGVKQQKNDACKINCQNQVAVREKKFRRALYDSEKQQSCCRCQHSDTVHFWLFFTRIELQNNSSHPFRFIAEYCRGLFPQARALFRVPAVPAPEA